jgi:hypothetical protein
MRAYREEVKWCQENNLSLNVRTKVLIMDFRRE